MRNADAAKPHNFLREKLLILALAVARSNVEQRVGNTSRSGGTGLMHTWSAYKRMFQRKPRAESAESIIRLFTREVVRAVRRAGAPYHLPPLIVRKF